MYIDKSISKKSILSSMSLSPNLSKFKVFHIKTTLNLVILLFYFYNIVLNKFNFQVIDKKIRFSRMILLYIFLISMN